MKEQANEKMDDWLSRRKNIKEKKREEYFLESDEGDEFWESWVETDWGHYDLTIWCTKCNTLMKTGDYTHINSKEGVIYTCPKCNYKIVVMNDRKEYIF